MSRIASPEEQAAGLELTQALHVWFEAQRERGAEFGKTVALMYNIAGTAAAPLVIGQACTVAELLAVAHRNTIAGVTRAAKMIEDHLTEVSAATKQ